MSRRTLLAWAGLSLLLLPLAFLLSPPGSPPLYDGLGFPEDPYLFLDGRTSAPSGAAVAVDVPPGGSPQSYAATPERGPQAALLLLPGALQADEGNTRVEARLDPVPPPGPVADGELLGNAYRVDVVGGRLVDQPEKAVVQLRVPDVIDDPVTVELHDGRTWRTLPTRRIGAHVHSAFVPEVGVVAAVRIRDASRSLAYGEQSGSRRSALLLVGGSLALLLAAVALVRARRQHPGGAP